METNYEMPKEVIDMMLANENIKAKETIDWQLTNAWADYMEENNVLDIL